MKLFKLWVHQKTFSDSEFVINPKEFPAVKVGVVVEIFHPEDEFSRLLLQVKCLREDFQQKDTVSVESSIASAFQLRAYKDVYVNIVNPKDVTVDLVELTYKEQYFSRSDMWRMKKSLIGSCVYLTKKVVFADMRVQVDELWAKGDRVSCGVIGENTRVTFRSSTAQVNIFIQMSSEMWDFDAYGDLYFEKAVSGFLADLFAKWKEKNCLHDVTIVMFSRTFYHAKSMDEIPPNMRECIQQDYQGRFYEDFYRVVVQNERYDEWTPTMIKLKQLFIEYLPYVLNYHQKDSVHVPKAWNSSAAQGNLMETLNMSLNVYEKYYLDRNFDRTGKLSIIITPGVGVFEVDRELTNLTKKRTIDCGNGSDLVCMGEQPLHAVPLLKFHSKTPTNNFDVGDDYNIPHWMNHSFYHSRNQVKTSSIFVPRIKFIPKTDLPKTETNDRQILTARHSSYFSTDDDNFPFLDYDEYDAQVFRIPTTRVKPGRGRNSTLPGSIHPSSSAGEAASAVLRSGPVHIPAASRSRDSISSSLDSILVKDTDDSQSGQNYTLPGQMVVGSAGSPVGHHGKYSIYNYRSRRALINPFAPSTLHFKVTSNRRRWVHAFPTVPEIRSSALPFSIPTPRHRRKVSTGPNRNPRGAAVQPHHQHSSQSVGDDRSDSISDTVSPPGRDSHSAQLAAEIRRQRSHRSSECSDTGDPINIRHKVASSESSDSNTSTVGPLVGSLKEGRGIAKVSSQSNMSLSTVDSSASISSIINAYEQNGSGAPSSSGGNRVRTYTSSAGVSSQSSKEFFSSSEYKIWSWGVTGEQEWTPELTTGVDWKSMTKPASLPVTTDFFPDKRSLQNDFLVADYTLLPDDFNTDLWQRPGGMSQRNPLSTVQVYRELICARLAMGFQMVMMAKTSGSSSQSCLSSSPYQQPSSFLRSHSKNEAVEEHILSIGRIFHKLKLNGPNITVTRYWPRHPFPQKAIHYTYRFQVPDSQSYDVSWTDFFNEKLENYNWNYLDQYICTRGEGDFGLVETMKFWRSRFFLLPAMNSATKKIIDGVDRCDIYEECNSNQQQELIAGFLRHIEILNKIRRPGQNRKPKKSLSRRASMSSDQFTELSSGSALASELRKLSTVVTPALDQLSMGSPSLVEVNSVTRENSDDFILSSTSPSSQIIDAMLQQQTGLNFLSKQKDLPALPPFCFIAGEAVMWVMRNVENCSDHKAASQLLQKMIDEQLMCHASRNPKHPFINGFYLYSIKDKQQIGKASDAELQLYPSNYYYNLSFAFDWCEVSTVTNPVDAITPVPEFLQESVPESDEEASVGIASSQQTSQFHKYVHVDIEQAQKGDRIEWGTARYHGHYNPLCAFEIEVQWMVATGCILGELISTWSRKASACSFHLLPVPGDPFALPYNANSDPLRGPIFVPLSIDCLKDGKTHLFEEFDKNTRERRLQLFQKSILRRFGFMSMSWTPNRTTAYGSEPENEPQYVHCSGGMFVLLPNSKAVPPKNKDGTHKNPATAHADYINRQRSRGDSFTEKVPYVEERVGFLWTWNFMLTKRWRSAHTGCENFQDRMLADFRAFCRNDSNRLRNYWDYCMSLKQ